MSDTGLTVPLSFVRACSEYAAAVSLLIKSKLDCAAVHYGEKGNEEGLLWLWIVDYCVDI